MREVGEGRWVGGRLEGRSGCELCERSRGDRSAVGTVEEASDGEVFGMMSLMIEN